MAGDGWRAGPGGSGPGAGAPFRSCRVGYRWSCSDPESNARAGQSRRRSRVTQNADPAATRGLKRRHERSCRPSIAKTLRDSLPKDWAAKPGCSVAVHWCAVAERAHRPPLDAICHRNRRDAALLPTRGALPRRLAFRLQGAGAPASFGPRRPKRREL